MLKIVQKEYYQIKTMAASSMKNGSQEHKRLHIYSNIFFSHHYDEL